MFDDKTTSIVIGAVLGAMLSALACTALYFGYVDKPRVDLDIHDSEWSALEARSLYVKTPEDAALEKEIPVASKGVSLTITSASKDVEIYRNGFFVGVTPIKNKKLRNCSDSDEWLAVKNNDAVLVPIVCEDKVKKHIAFEDIHLPVADAHPNNGVSAKTRH